MALRALRVGCLKRFPPGGVKGRAIIGERAITIPIWAIDRMCRGEKSESQKNPEESVQIAGMIDALSGVAKLKKKNTRKKL